MDDNTLTIVGDGAVVSLDGELTIYQVAAARERLSKRLFGGDLTLELGSIRALDTAGVQLLLALRKQAQASGYNVELRAEIGAAVETLSVFGLGSLLSVREER